MKSSSEVDTIIARPVIITATKAAPTVIRIGLRANIISLDIERYPHIIASIEANIIANLKSDDLTMR